MPIIELEKFNRSKKQNRRQSLSSEMLVLAETAVVVGWHLFWQKLRSFSRYIASDFNKLFHFEGCYFKRRQQKMLYLLAMKKVVNILIKKIPVITEQLSKQKMIRKLHN